MRSKYTHIQNEAVRFVSKWLPTTHAEAFQFAAKVVLVGITELESRFVGSISSISLIHRTRQKWVKVRSKISSLLESYVKLPK